MPIRLRQRHAQVERTRVVLEQAQQQFDKVKDVPGVGMLQQSLQLQQATIGWTPTQLPRTRPDATGATGGQPSAELARPARARRWMASSSGPTKEQVDMAQASGSIRRSWPWNRRSAGWRTHAS